MTLLFVSREVDDHSIIRRLLSVSTVESCPQFELVHRMKNLGNRQNKRFTGSRYSLNARMYNGEQRQQTSTKKFKKHFNDCGEAFELGNYYSRLL